MKKQNNRAVFSLELQHFWGNPMSTKEDYVQYLKKLKNSKYTKGKMIFLKLWWNYPSSSYLVAGDGDPLEAVLAHQVLKGELEFDFKLTRAAGIGCTVGNWNLLQWQKQRQKKVTFSYHRPLLICLFCRGPFSSSTFNLLYCVYIWEWQRNRFQYFFNQH